VNGLVRRRLGTRKASFAPPDDVRAMTGMEIGGVTPLALPADLPLWVDAAVLQRDRIVLGGGSRGCKVVGAPALLTAVGAEVIDDLAKPLPED
jgi:prolyl-tRNA editing enzyme YbaK/EbsC (Cys-tRNA(Pro) deacylase)